MAKPKIYSITDYLFTFSVPSNFRFPELLTVRLSKRLCKANFIFSSLLIYSFQIILIGCVLPIPTIPDSVPFPDELTASIKIQITTREEVEKILGEPIATRANRFVYIYAKPQNLFILTWGIPWTSMGGVQDIDRNHLLIIQFDKNDNVKHIDHISGDGSKTQNGIYIYDTGLRSKEYLKLYQHYHAPPNALMVLYDRKYKDYNAKRFMVPPNKCSIYLFSKLHWTEWLFRQNRDSVSLDDETLGDFGLEGYFNWIVDPGFHNIYISGVWHSPQLMIPGHLTVECQEGQILFVEQTWEGEGLSHVKSSLRIIPDFEEGQLEILNRKLVLDRISLIDE